MKDNKLLEKFNSFFLDEKLKEKIEKIVVGTAIVSFIIHLIFIAVVDSHLLENPAFKNLTISPVSAIYTPFSIILIYEVYLLVYYLPKSITNYIGKQYEIITLILIRKIFYDLSELEFSSDWFSIDGDLKFTVDIIATLVLFTLIFLFYKINASNRKKGVSLTDKTKRYIRLKKTFASILVPVVAGLAIYSLVHWIYESSVNPYALSTSIKSINTIFFDDFFSILILTDVLLLLFSFFQTDEFSRVIRNSGFIISTILIKLSFSADGILNAILIVVAVSFGVILLYIYSQYSKIESPKGLD
jgi:hypothetical protein